jgi:hypothetical protein
MASLLDNLSIAWSGDFDSLIKEIHEGRIKSKRKLGASRRRFYFMAKGQKRPEY